MLKILKEISHNDKVLLDYIDVKKILLPIFITNPQLSFIIDAGIKYKFYLITHTIRKEYKVQNRNK